MKKRAISIVLAMTLLLAGFMTSPSIARAAQINPKTEFTLAEMLEDYDQLWADLRENYPFFTALEQRGIDVESLRLSNREVLINRVKDLDGFLHLLQDTFFRMDHLAHLSLVDASLYQSLLSFKTTYPFKPRDEIVANPQTQAIYEFLGARDASATPYRYPDVDMRYLPEINGAYFHFKSFHHSLMERDQSIVTGYLASLGDLDHVIFDISGNGGGNTSYWWDHIVSPFGGEYEYEAYIFLNNTPVNQRYFMDAGLFDIEPLSDLPPKLAISPFAHELGFTHFYHVDGVYSLDGSTEIVNASKAKRWVLVDQGTFSAADGFASFCKGTGWATLVGKRTLGDGDGTEPVMISLKNTGLLVRFSSFTAIHSDGTMNAVAGTPPDIFCQKGETPLDACLRVIANMP